MRTRHARYCAAQPHGDRNRVPARIQQCVAFRARVSRALPRHTERVSPPRDRAPDGMTGEEVLRVSYLQLTQAPAPIPVPRSRGMERIAAERLTLEDYLSLYERV